MRLHPTINPDELQRYVRSITNLPKPRPPGPRGFFPFITISRQTGAGGHTLAEAIVREMALEQDRRLFGGWQILDQELCVKILTDPELRVSMDSLLTERFKTEIEDSLSQIFTGAPPQIALYRRIAKTIRTFATLGKVIVVGRAGSFITRDMPLGIHVRLVASKAARVATMMRQFGLCKEEAEREAQEQDASRALLVKTYFSGKDINDPLHYDAVWNTDRVAIPALAAFLAGWVKRKSESYSESAVQAPAPGVTA